MRYGFLNSCPKETIPIFFKLKFSVPLWMKLSVYDSRDPNQREFQHVYRNKITDFNFLCFL